MPGQIEMSPQSQVVPLGGLTESPKKEIDDDLDEKERLRKVAIEAESRPMSFVNFLVTWPFTCMGLCFSALIVLTIIMVSTNMAMLSEPDVRDYLIWDAEPVENFDKRNMMAEYVEKYGGSSGDKKTLRS